MPSLLKRIATVLAVLLVIVAATSLAVAVARLGGPDEVFQIPAEIDQSDSEKQDGFDLVAIIRGQPGGYNFSLPTGQRMYLATRQTSGDTVLWIRPPVLPPTTLFESTTEESALQLRKFYRIHAYSSIGDRFPLQWYYEGGCLYNVGDSCAVSELPKSTADLIGAVIPAGYPSDVHYFDVSITDPYGHRAKWRIVRLPRMRPTLDITNKPSYSVDGAAVQLSALRTWPDGNIVGDEWPKVSFNLTLLPLAAGTRHQWEFRPSPNYPPSLAWEPYRLPWLTRPDSNAEVNVDDSWLLSRQKIKTGVTCTISSPYVRNSSVAIYHGVFSQFELRQDSVDIRDVSVETVEATEAGLREDTYCLYEPKKAVVKSTSGLTILLPKQKKSPQTVIYMVPNSLNLFWRLTPLSPGSSNQTAGMLPDSPLCRKYHRPVTVWFEAFADGKPLGIMNGVPWQPSNGDAAMVHFPADMALPKLIRDLRITIHQRVDLQRIPVTLSAKIVNQYPS